MKFENNIIIFAFVHIGIECQENQGIETIEECTVAWVMLKICTIIIIFLSSRL